MTTREDLKFEVLLLARGYADEPDRDFRAKCLILIDQVATYARDDHRGLPQHIADTLASAMHAAIRRDVGGVIQLVETALVRADEPPTQHMRSTPELPPRRGAPQRQPKSTPAVATPRSIAQAIDPLLAKLRAKRPKD